MEEIIFKNENPRDIIFVAAGYISGILAVNNTLDKLEMRFLKAICDAVLSVPMSDVGNVGYLFAFGKIATDATRELGLDNSLRTAQMLGEDIQLRNRIIDFFAKAFTEEEKETLHRRLSE